MVANLLKKHEKAFVKRIFYDFFCKLKAFFQPFVLIAKEEAALLWGKYVVHYISGRTVMIKLVLHKIHVGSHVRKEFMVART